MWLAPAIRSVIAKAGATTVAYLAGGLLLGFGVAIAFSSVPIRVDDLAKNTFAAMVLLAIPVLASIGWGRKMVEVSGIENQTAAGGAALGAGLRRFTQES
ncbi:MAG: hypothetical protein ACE5JF_06935 [Anaerolineales bacterium]